jgi:hypothetical protein
MGIEPTTYSLGSCRSTTELRPQAPFNRTAIDKLPGRREICNVTGGIAELRAFPLKRDEQQRSEATRPRIEHDSLHAKPAGHRLLDDGKLAPAGCYLVIAVRP